MSTYLVTKNSSVLRLPGKKIYYNTFFTIPIGQVINLLENFSDAVHYRHYSKYSYDTWCYLFKCVKEETGSSNIPIILSKSRCVEFHFGIDNVVTIYPSTFSSLPSLAEFIFDQFQEIEETDITITNDYNVYVKNKDYLKTISSADSSFITIDAATFNTIDKNQTVIKPPIINKKGNKTMNKTFNFDFGPVNSDVRMSMYGIAVRNNAGTYVSYDASTGELKDVDIFNFNGRKFMYKVPVAVNSVAVGDVVIHQSKYVFVIEVEKDNKSFKVIDPVTSEIKTVIPVRNMFGFNFMTKVVSLFDFSNMNDGSFNEDNPFGNMLPLMLMGDDNGDTSMSDLMLMMMFTNNNSNPFGDKNNPFMMMMMMKALDKDNKDEYLPF